MMILTAAERVVFAWPRARFLALLFALMFVKTGVWHFPAINLSISMARAPFTPAIADPSSQFIMTSWLSPFVAWCLGATSDGAFLLLHLGFSIAFTALFVVHCFSQFDDRTARSAMVIFAALPVSTIAYFWVGIDSLTLLLMLGALMTRHRPVVASLLGFLLGLQHFEQAVVGFGALSAATFLAIRFGEKELFPLRTGVVVVLAICAGKLALMGLFHMNDVVTTGRIGWAATYLSNLLSQFWLHSQVIVWGMLGLGWLVVLRYLDQGRSGVILAGTLLALLPVLVLVADRTRVMANVTFPLLFAHWLSNRTFLEALSRREVAGLFVLWAVMPLTWVGGGEPRWSVFPYMLVYAANQLFGWFTLPTENIAEWPFGGR
jgi:hypothetical protein